MWFYMNVMFGVAFVLLVLKLALKLRTGWCTSNVCLVGKTIIITGANSGIGYETAADFAKRGARVILACRDPSKGKTAEEQIIRETDNPNVMFKQLDLASLKSVREFAKDIIKSEKRLDILVNNAGVAVTGPSLTEDGLLHAMQVNYFGHFLLTNLLLDLMKTTPNSRILNLSSISATFALPVNTNKLNSYWRQCIITDYFTYARSKLCIVLFTMELAERLKNTSVTAYSLNPGLVETGIFRGMPLLLRVLTLGMIHFFFKRLMKFGMETYLTHTFKKVLYNFVVKYIEEPIFGDTKIYMGFPMASLAMHHPVFLNLYLSHFENNFVIYPLSSSIREYDLMKETPNSRIINVSSNASLLALHLDTTQLNYFRHKIIPLQLLQEYFVYARSKLCNILFTMELAERLKNTSATAYSLHPGIVETGVFRGMPLLLRVLTLGIIHLFFKNVIEGAQTTIYCAVTKGIENHSGKYFEDCRVIPGYRPAKMYSHLTKDLWEASEKLVQLNI